MLQFEIDGNIDWVALRRQKLTLMKAIDMYTVNDKEKSDDLLGLLHLVDNVQDNAVLSGMWTEKEIFNIERT